jgi:hypothetical protein
MSLCILNMPLHYFVLLLAASSHRRTSHTRRCRRRISTDYACSDLVDCDKCLQHGFDVAPKEFPD